jgi:hypothetical protein
VIYNNSTKFELCRYWQKLEEKGFDPTVELNKSLEIFDIVNIFIVDLSSSSRRYVPYYCLNFEIFKRV